MFTSMDRGNTSVRVFLGSRRKAKKEHEKKLEKDKEYRRLWNLCTKRI